ncbi:hypothetical protein Hanom_Chr07g00627471 [Helianthus anomalus]
MKWSINRRKKFAGDDGDYSGKGFSKCLLSLTFTTTVLLSLSCYYLQVCL